MSLFTSRARIAGLALALVGGGLLVFPAPAQAGILDEPKLVSDVEFATTGPAACTASGPGDVGSPLTPFAADGLDVVSTSSSSGTFTNNGDATDVTTLSASARTTVKATAGADALSEFSMSTQFTTSAQASKGQGQQCGGVTRARGFVQFQFDLPSTRVVTVMGEGPEGTTYVLTIMRNVPADPPQGYQYFGVGGHVANTSTTVLPAGTYIITVTQVGTLQAPTPSDPATSRAGTILFDVSFGAPGAANGADTGDGGKYLAMADGRSCPAGSLAATWTSKAGKGKNRRVKKATFFVNDVKVATVKKPKKSQVSTLNGLVSGKPAVVEARIRLAKKGAGTVTVERSYLTCT